MDREQVRVWAASLGLPLGEEDIEAVGKLLEFLLVRLAALGDFASEEEPPITHAPGVWTS